MKFEYTGRHVDVTPTLRSHVEEHFSKLDHIFNDTTARAHIIIEVEKNRQMGEVLLHWRGETLTARDVNADMYQALTRAISKIEKQAVKLKKKLIDRKQGARALSTLAPDDGQQIEASPNAPRIISARRYPIKPMTAEEAALKLSEDSNQFIVFRDSETNRIGVIYKRKDGNYGLIEP
ncbi:MAG: putative sigma-54 modulation protein [Acidobacteriota bacterium]|jgi:putative sigma-54 modulation protein|nr:putative sigma-54 modulation protein [Acidobacteriota bacterium]